MNRQTKPHMYQSRQAGFTIVELMIATLAFALVLVIITTGVLHFTASYYKGVSSSATQTDAEGVIDTISQAVQYSTVPASETDGSEGFFCAGSKLFVYDLGYPYKGNPAGANGAGLYEMDRTPGSCTDRAPAGGTELLNTNVRITNIAVQNIKSGDMQNGGVWQITLSLAYGDADLLCDTTVTGSNPGSCTKDAPSFSLTQQVQNSTPGDIVCKSGYDGSQFCSTATLSTVAQQRIVN